MSRYCYCVVCPKNFKTLKLQLIIKLNRIPNINERSDEMIRKLVESDRQSLIEYLSMEESLNISILAHIKIYGLDGDVLTMFGEFDKDNNYVSVLLYTVIQSIFYAYNRVFNKEWLTIFETLDFANIGGEKSVLKEIHPYLKDYITTTSFVAEATSLPEKYEKSDYTIVKITTIEQCEKLYDLLKTIDEFVHRTKDKKNFIETRMKALAMGNTYYIEEYGRMISTATASAETTNSAVIVMVGTDVEYRNRGLASILLKHIMYEYIEEKHKSLCLFYDNPKAGSIYRRLGFQEVYEWVTLFKN